MTKLGDLYHDFRLIDTDAPGGYARVAQVTAHPPEPGEPAQRAFKVMRWDVPWEAGFSRFVEEIRLLIQIFGQEDLPREISETVTQLYEYGFVPTELPQLLDKYQNPPEDLPIQQTKHLTKFKEIGEQLQRDEPDRWRPFLVVELAEYDDSLFRQINRHPKTDAEGLYRMPTGEVVFMAGKLLDTINYLHTHLNRAYMDWKPEHVYWNGKELRVKLIDWNVTVPLDDYPGKEQNIRDDVRLFCGAVLYSSLTMVDLEGKQLGAQPITRVDQFNPVQGVRRRYWTHDPVFYKANRTLDDKIKAILRRGLIPDQGYPSALEVKQALFDYAEQELGLKFEPDPESAGEAYWRALKEIRIAQQALFEAYGHVIQAIRVQGAVPEFTRLRQMINKTFDNFPLP